MRLHGAVHGATGRQVRPRRVGTFVPARPGPRGGNAVRIPTGPLTAPLMVSLRVAGSGLVTAPHVALPTATGAVPRGTGWLFRAVRRNGRGTVPAVPPVRRGLFRDPA